MASCAHGTSPKYWRFRCSQAHQMLSGSPCGSPFAVVSVARLMAQPLITSSAPESRR